MIVETADVSLLQASVSVLHCGAGIFLPSALLVLLNLSEGRKNSDTPGSLFGGWGKMVWQSLLVTQVCFIFFMCA